MDPEDEIIEPALINGQPSFKKDNVSAPACELEWLRCQIKLLMRGLRSAWMSGASLHKATVLHRKRGGWARIAAGMVGGGKEEKNGSATEGSVERYKAQKWESWLESRGCQNWTAEGRRKIL
jgi:hypothetical protein